MTSLADSKSNSHHLLLSIRFIIFSSNLNLITLAGLPTTTAKDGTSFVTTEFAPITAPFPIVTPLKIIESTPIHYSLIHYMDHHKITNS